MVVPLPKAQVTLKVTFLPPDHFLHVRLSYLGNLDTFICISDKYLKIIGYPWHRDLPHPSNPSHATSAWPQTLSYRPLLLHFSFHPLIQVPHLRQKIIPWLVFPQYVLCSAVWIWPLSPGTSTASHLNYKWWHHVNCFRLTVSCSHPYFSYPHFFKTLQ